MPNNVKISVCHNFANIFYLNNLKRLWKCKFLRLCVLGLVTVFLCVSLICQFYQWFSNIRFFKQQVFIDIWSQFTPVICLYAHVYDFNHLLCKQVYFYCKYILQINFKIYYLKCYYIWICLPCANINILGVVDDIRFH